MSEPKLQIEVEPMEGGKALYLPLAPEKAGATAKVKVVLRLRLGNLEPAAVEVTGITFSFPGSAVPSVSMKRPDRVLAGGPKLAPGESKWWSNGVVELEDRSRINNALFLATPAPTKVAVAVTCAGFSEPASVTLDLLPTTTRYHFPFSASDLRVGESFLTSATHWANGGPAGGQIFAHDIGVQRRDGKNGWTEVHQGTDGLKNSDYLIYGKPIRAMANGTVEEWHDGMADNTKLKELPVPGPEPGSGNRMVIRHGDETVSYCHLQAGSIPDRLKKKGTPVVAGEAVGRIGNSGNSSHPHTHVECRKVADTKPLRPFAFTDAWVVDRSAISPPDPSGPWVKLTGQGIPNVATAIWPAMSTPAWYPPGWREVAHFGIPAADYQDVFERATTSGYRPVWLDGYEVDGKTFFNAIFRPSAGVTWVARHGMTAADYQAEFDKRSKTGFRIVNLCAYVDRGSARYGAIWVKATGAAARAYHGLSREEHQSRFNDWSSQGFRPLNIAVVAPAGTPTWAAFYEKADVGSFWVRSSLDPEEYQKAWDDNHAAGRTLAYLSAYQLGRRALFSAVFQERVPGTGGVVGRHNLTSGQMQAEYEAQLRLGRLTRVLTGYASGGVPRFAGAWRTP